MKPKPSRTFDALNRVTGVTFSDTTPIISYVYDDIALGNKGKGRLTKVLDGAGGLLLLREAALNIVDVFGEPGTVADFGQSAFTFVAQRNIVIDVANRRGGVAEGDGGDAVERIVNIGRDSASGIGAGLEVAGGVVGAGGGAGVGGDELLLIIQAVDCVISH